MPLAEFTDGYDGYRYYQILSGLVYINMEQSTSPALNLINNAAETSSSVIGQDETMSVLVDVPEIIQKTTSESDDELQIMCVIKQEKQLGSPIKVESGEEVVEQEEEVVCRQGTSSEEKTTQEQGSKSSSLQVQAITTRCNSPKAVTCSICLGEFDNKSFLDQCFHAFCFYCILQWSEIVRTCPLCKATFSSIIHSVKSMMEYELHRLPLQARPSKQHISLEVRRVGHRITSVDYARVSQQPFAAARTSNLWEWRRRRRERRLSLQRRKQVEAKRKRKSIYVNNLWVHHVAQSGRAKFRNTSPQFFHDNPACTHRLVPWLTRELNCVMEEEQRHVDFLVQLVMTLIPRVRIDSEEFIEQLQPFLFDKTHHFAHEFLSFACSPFDMGTYDERAQYECPPLNISQDSETPFVFNTSTTGWDSPDEFSKPRLSPLTSSPGPSGLSRTVLSRNWNEGANCLEGQNWSPTQEQQGFLNTYESSSTDSPIYEVTTRHHITVSSPEAESNFDLHELNHQHKTRYKGKGKKQLRQSNSTAVLQPALPLSISRSDCITVSSCGSTESRSDVIVVSSEERSSPLQIPTDNYSRKNDCNSKRRTSSEARSSTSRSKSHKDSLRLKKREGKSHDKHRKSLSSSRVKTSSARTSRRSTRSKSPDPHSRAHRYFSSKTEKNEKERASSPTEEEMKREIEELEKKIAEDTKRLTQLLIKQEKRRFNNIVCKSSNAVVAEESGTNELSR